MFFLEKVEINMLAFYKHDISSLIGVVYVCFLRVSSHCVCMYYACLFVFFLNVLCTTYSRVHISSDEVFSKILKTPSILQKQMIPHRNGLLVFIEMKIFFSFVE